MMTNRIGDSPAVYGNARSSSPALSSGTARSNGVCMMSKNWKEEQHPNFINFISSFLRENSFRLNIVPIAPDFIFNCGGLSAAFMFVTNWNPDTTSQVYSRALKLKEQFARFYVVITLSTKEQNELFVQTYFKSGFDIGRPPFVHVLDLEMGFEKIVKISHSLGVFKQQDVINRMKEERKKIVQSMEAFLSVVTSIPGIDTHDANSLGQAVGSIEDIAKASKEYLLENTDLSPEKVENILRFFRDPDFFLSPKFN